MVPSAVTLTPADSTPPQADFFQPFWRRAAVFVLLAFLIAFNGLGAIGIFDLDEGLYSTASRQMLESGDWIVPRIGPDVRFAKPPLIYWLQAPSIAVFGPTSFAVRFPSALCVVLTGLLLWWTLGCYGRERAGWLAALVFVGCPLSLILARQGIIDALLGLCFTGVLVSWLEIENGNRRAYWWLGLTMGAAILAKSTIGLLLPVAGFGMWQLLRRHSLRSWALPLLGAVVLALVIAAPWHYLMWQATGSRFWQEAFVSNQIKRARGESWGHVQPFWFYVPLLIGVMLPWSGLLPVSWFQALKRIFTPEQKPSFQPALWAWWAFVIFIFFSIAKSKLPGYIFPALPPLAVLIGCRLDDLRREKLAPSLVETISLVVIPLLAGIGFLGAGFVGQAWRGQQSGAMLFGHEVSQRAVDIAVLLEPIFFVAGAAFVLVGLLLIAARNRPTYLALLMASVSAIVALFLVYGVAPIYSRDAIEPLHSLVREVKPQIDQGATLVSLTLRPYRPSVRFVVGDTPRVHEISFDQIMGRLVTSATEAAGNQKLDKAIRAALVKKAGVLGWQQGDKIIAANPNGYILAMTDNPPPASLPLQRVETRGDFTLYRWPSNRAASTIGARSGGK